MQYRIRPFKYQGWWAFTDPDVGLDKEPLVEGIDTMLDRLTTDIKNAESGFELVFSDQKFDGWQVSLQWRRGDKVSGGDWYYCPEYDIEGWLCPALGRYFTTPPQAIYVATGEAAAKSETRSQERAASTMLRETTINLDTPDDYLPDVQVRALDDGNYECTGTSDFGYDFRMMLGDKFSADEVEPGLFKLRQVVEPSDVCHFQFDLGLFAWNPSLSSNPEALADARNDLGDYIENGVMSAALQRYLAEHGGGYDIDEFFQWVGILLHVPRIHVADFLAVLPSLSPELNRESKQEVFSGLQDDFR